MGLFLFQKGNERSCDLFCAMVIRSMFCRARSIAANRRRKRPIFGSSISVPLYCSTVLEEGGLPLRKPCSPVIRAVPFRMVRSRDEIRQLGCVSAYPNDTT